MLLPAVFIAVTIAQQVSPEKPKTMTHYDPWAPQAATAIRTRITEPIDDFASEPSPVNDENGRLFRFEPVADVDYFEVDIGGDERSEIFLNNANAPLYLGSKEWVAYLPSPDGEGYIRVNGVLLRPGATAHGEIEPTRTRGRIVSTSGPSLLQYFYDSEGPDIVRAYYVKNGVLYEQSMGEIGTSDFLKKYFAKPVQVKRINIDQWKAERATKPE